MDAPTLVMTKDGPVQATVTGSTRVFFAIPFAAPPVGDLRWKPPAPPAPWTTPIAAKSPGPECPQLDALTSTMLDSTSSEDCLTLNVWAPKVASATPEAGDGVDLRRLVRHRERRHGRLRRPEALGGDRRDRGHDQLPPRPARLPRAPGAARRGPGAPVLRHVRHRGPARRHRLGARRTSRRSAATRRTSRSSASPPAASACATTCSRRRARASSSAPSSRAAPAPTGDTATETAGGHAGALARHGARLRRQVPRGHAHVHPRGETSRR